jgi:hypothetical protein
MNSYKSLVSSKGFRRAMLVFILVFILLVTIRSDCNKTGTGIIQNTEADGTCGTVDTVKSAFTGEISAYINNREVDADYYLILTGLSSGSKFIGLTNSSTDWVIFGNLPSGTYICSWAVSGCSINNDDGEVDIPGPDQITIK